MKVKILPEAFKKHFPEPNESQGIDQVVVASYMENFYKEPTTIYPFKVPYTEKDTAQVALANKQALQICDHMEALGLTNFSGLKSKFQGSPKNEFEASQRTLIKQTMEAILHTFETATTPPRDVLAAQYKDRQFNCADGTLTNLQAILAELSLGNQGIGAYISQQGRDFIIQFATDMYRKNQFIEFPWAYRAVAPGMEIHNITSLVNSIAPEYGMKVKTKEEDHYLSTIYSKSRNKLSGVVKQAFQHEVTVSGFIEAIARNVAFGLPNATSANFISEVVESIERLKISHIVDASTLIQYENYITTGYKPNIESIIKDATTLYLHEKGVLQLPEKDLELTALRIDLEKSKDAMSSSNAVTADILNTAKEKGNLEYAIKYMIDNQLKLDEDDYGTKDPIEYAMKQNLKIDGTDPKRYALRMVIDEHLKTDNPAIQKSLKEKYEAIQNIGEKQPPKLLTMESNLGQFLNNPKAPEILVNHTNLQGKHTLTTENIDYTKCDLDLIKKCKEVHEKTSKSRDYSNLSTIQKVGIAFATIIPIIGNAIAYYAIKSHNRSEKSKLEAQIGHSLHGIQSDLSTLYQKPKQHAVTEQAKKEGGKFKLEKIIKRVEVYRTGISSTHPIYNKSTSVEKAR